MVSPATVLLNEPHILSRAGQYANPGNEAAALPIVYGDLTEGAVGNWELPQVDNTAGAMIFAFAGHIVLSVANGNSVTLYDGNGAAISGSNYTFDEDNDLESKGSIATCAFGSSDPVLPVTARGKGKADGATLLENPITIIEDFILNIASLGTVAGDVFNTASLESAREIAANGSYKAAGIISENTSPGSLIQQILKNFLGVQFLRTDRKIYLLLEQEVIDASSLPFAGAPQGFIVARQRGDAYIGPRRREEIINKPAAFYRFNYPTYAFRGFDDGTTKQNGKSVEVHGALGRTDGPFEMNWIRDRTTLRTVQGIITSLFKSSPRLFEVIQKAETSLEVERGDYVSLSLDFAYDTNSRDLMTNQICQVKARTYEYANGTVTWQLRDTGIFLSTQWLLDGTVTLDGSRKLGSDRDKVLRG